MAQVRFTSHLRRYFPALAPVEVEASSVADLVAQLDRLHPGLASYLVDERGALRPHVNIFVDEEGVADRRRLSDPLVAASRVYVLQALSGG